MDSLTLPKGGIAVDLLIEMNMSKSAVGKPFSIAPDISYGVSDKLTLTLAHSGYGTTGFAGGVGGGLCLAGTDNGCEKVYNNVGLLALFGLSSSPSMKLAADGGIVIRHISDPMFLDIKVGVLGKWSSGKIGITFNPSVLIGATKRDSGNKESLGVPVTLMYHAAAKLGVGIQTGIAGPFTDFSKLFVVPLSVGANYMVNDHIGVGGAFTVTQITGGSALRDASITGFDGRALNIWLSWMK